jgi:hypothetical protein
LCRVEKRAGLKPGLYKGKRRLKMVRAARLRGLNCFWRVKIAL